jgi:magnesium transporter
MARLLKRLRKKPGLPPGTLYHDKSLKPEKARITMIEYGEEGFQHRTVEGIDDCFPVKNHGGVKWINIDGLKDPGTVEKLGKHLGIHPLVLEDIVNVGQRPKLEDYGDYLFIVTKMVSLDRDGGGMEIEQVSLLLGKGYVISFQERIGDVFEPIRERIASAKGRIVSQGADYLAYALLDIIVDNYFVVLESVGDRVEAMDEEIIDDPSPEKLGVIRGMKRDMILLRKSVWPLREVIGGMERLESELIDDSTNIYLRDVYDHTIQVIDTIEALRDLISGILDIYLTSVSNRMNEVMKVLTIIATIFIPITFIAGIYGMNFEFMPELKYRFAYPAVWGMILIVAVVMLVYFRRKRWI